MFSCLLVGPPGAGKTTAASTAPGPVLFIDVDNKLHKMENLKDKIASGQVIQWAIDAPLTSLSMTRMANEVTQPQAKVTQPTPKGYKMLASMMDKLVASNCMIEHEGKKIQIKTVVFDSYTRIEEHLKRHLYAANNVVTISLPLFGTILNNFEILNDTGLSLNANVIFIAHEKATKDDLTGKITYTPLISGQMKDKIGKDFEEVYYLEKSVVGGVAKYEMMTVGSSTKPCRTSRTLGARVEPDFSKIYKEA